MILDTSGVLAEELQAERANDLLRRDDVIAVLHRLADNHADLAIYGEEANARQREAMEAAFTHARCAVALMPAYVAS